jgi:hypothetical protein
MNNKPGQVGLLLLVVLGLLVTLVLSVASRTLSDSVLTRQEKEQSSAFGVAETGIEEALRMIRVGDVPVAPIPIGDSTGVMSGNYNVQSGSELEIYLKEGESGNINLTGYVGNVWVSWTKADSLTENVTCIGQGSGQAPAAMEAAWYGASGTVGRFYYNPYNPGDCNITGNGFFPAAPAVTNPGFRSEAWIPMPLGTTFLRIRPLYSGATVKVTPAGAALLPSQFYKIQSQVKGGDVSKEIEVKRTIDSAPTVFDFAVFSGSTIVK